MTEVASVSAATVAQGVDEEGDAFLVEARNAALNALRKQKILKEKRRVRRLTSSPLRAIDEGHCGEQRDSPPPLPSRRHDVSHTPCGYQMTFFDTRQSSCPQNMSPFTTTRREMLR